MTGLLEDFAADRPSILGRYRNEQRYLSAWTGEAKAWWPEDWIVSFKRHCLPPFCNAGLPGSENRQRTPALSSFMAIRNLVQSLPVTGRGRGAERGMCPGSRRCGANRPAIAQLQSDERDGCLRTLSGKHRPQGQRPTAPWCGKIACRRPVELAGSGPPVGQGIRIIARYGRSASRAVRTGHFESAPQSVFDAPSRVHSLIPGSGS